MPLIKGIVHFPTLFVPKIAKGATVAKYNVGVLLHPTDPQVAMLQAEMQQAKLNGCPSGYSGADECFGLYETKIPPSKDYHDPRFVGWYLFTCSSKEDDGKPPVVDANYVPVIDPGQVYSGMIVYVNAGISYYSKGKAGIGGWLNGVMLTVEEPPFGRLDNRPSVEQMFAQVGAAPPVAAPPVAAPPVAAPPVALIMTAAAHGVTYEQYMATPGWTDQMLIDQGLAIKPSFV